MQSNGIGALVRQFMHDGIVRRFADRDHPRFGKIGDDGDDAAARPFKARGDQADFSQSALDRFERLKDFLSDIIEAFRSRQAEEEHDGEHEQEHDDDGVGSTRSQSGLTLFVAYYYVETTVVASFDTSA